MKNMTTEKYKIIIPEGFSGLPEEQQKPISDQIFQYLWGWKNKRHNEPILVNEELYWIIQSPRPNKTTFQFCNEEQVAVWSDTVYCQRPFARPIGVAEFKLHQSRSKKDNVQSISRKICNEWSEYRIADAKQKIEDWKVLRKELFIKHKGVDTPYHDPFIKKVA